MPLWPAIPGIERCAERKRRLNILITLDRNYLEALKVMLGSMYLNNPCESFDIYFIADGIGERDLSCLDALCPDGGVRYHFLSLSDGCFRNAPENRYYSRAMYYRLLAPQILPRDMERILYIDPDTLIINSLRELYETDFQGHLYAAAMHKGITGISGPLGKIRLPENESRDYFNSGVLLMNLPLLREVIDPKNIFSYVEKYHAALILPDQDVLNALYGEKILPIDELRWNYDARDYNSYLLISQGEADMDWVMENTAILHFCGKHKPWQKGCRTRFAALYKHYRSLVFRCCEQEQAHRRERINALQRLISLKESTS